ncbi:MFS transporter [Candidatus Woesearchaeota archaeon]|nr:MFS transporter [Candidatus Woesearchaeota archaeon]
MNPEFRILWKVYLAEIIRGIGAFIVPFIIIFLQGKSLNLAQIGILWGSISLTNFFMEIPTGVIADKYGRKFSAMLGFFVQYLSFFLVIFTHNFLFLLGLYVLFGIGFTLTSGAYDAWIFEYLKSNKKEHLMHNFYSRKLSFSYLGLIIAGLLGGYLAGFFDLYWLIVFDTIFGMIFLIILLSVPDPPILKDKEYIGFKLFFKKTKEGFDYIKQNKTLLLLTIASMFFTVAVGAKELLSQPVYIELGMPLSYIGYVASISGLVIFIIPNLIFGFSKKFPKKIIIIFSIIEFISIFGLIFVENYLIFALLIIISFLCGAIISPISDSIFQHNSKTEIRATSMSMLNMLISVVYFIVFLTFGILADAYGAKIILALSGLFIIPSIICYSLIKN